jgi:hypothetical protein
VGELRAPHADADVLRAEPLHAEQVLLEARDGRAAFDLAQRGGVAAAPVEERGIGSDLDVRFPELLRRGVIDPTAAEGDDVLGVEAESNDVAPLGHLHDLTDGRGTRDLLANERRKAKIRCGSHGRDYRGDAV